MPLYVFKTHTPRIHPSVFVAPSAQIIGNVRIGSDSSVWFQTVIRGDLDTIAIGEKTNIQDLCMCHADEGIPLTIGHGITIGHRSVIHGCTVEDGCLIGMGAVIMNHAVIGKGSVIAAGTVVLEKTVIPPCSLVTGSPGRVKKTYDNPEQLSQSIQSMAQSYLENARSYSSPSTFYELK
ncbi:MAG: gamma carbonic anhydrase family protein [Desulfotignum sp.]|jgi:carbonic anhydrase/acetyltransferase-like protein (isoleucine patch superfamily)